MIDYVKKCFNNYATFDGRARRSEYWYFQLFYFLGLMVMAFVSGMIRFPALYFIFILAMIVPIIAVTIRRMHDTGKSGWYMLIPIYNFILALTPGDTGPNEYGSDPKNESAVRDSDVLDDQLV